MDVLFSVPGPCSSAAPSSVYGCGKHANKGLGCVPSARQMDISSYCTDLRLCNYISWIHTPVHLTSDLTPQGLQV